MLCPTGYAKAYSADFHDMSVHSSLNVVGGLKSFSGRFCRFGVVVVQKDVGQSVFCLILGNVPPGVLGKMLPVEVF